MPRVTVAVCTYDRVPLLNKCLQSLAQQTVDRASFDVLVVDNHGSAACRETAIAYGAAYVHEPAAGLSHARNRAAREATTDWLLYLDDDAVAHPDMMECLRLHLRNAAVRVIGGRYEHLFGQAPPDWIRHYYKRPVCAAPGEGLLVLNNDQYLAGCVFAAERRLFLDFPFRPDLGMQADRPGYGEESEWQDRVRRAGVPVHFDRAVAIDHLVRPDELTIRARIDKAYAHGRYRARTRVRGKVEKAEFFGRALRLLAKTIPYDVGRVLFRPNFSWRNGVVSTLGKLAYLRGEYGK